MRYKLSFLRKFIIWGVVSALNVPFCSRCETLVYGFWGNFEEPGKVGGSALSQIL